MNAMRAFGALVCLLSISSCRIPGTNHPDQSMVGPPVIFAPEMLETLYLPALLDPDNRSGWRGHEHDASGQDERYLQARETFYRYSTDPSVLEDRRNRVQDAIIAASSQRFGRFQQYLQEQSAALDFSLGSLATALAGMGAILTPASTVRALSGSAAIVSGTNAQWHQSYLNNLAVYVITEGIKKRRADILKIIRAEQLKSIKLYRVETAIGDAVAFHASCNIVEGLAAAQDSIQQIQDPGLRRLTELLVDNPLLGSRFPELAQQGQERRMLVLAARVNDAEFPYRPTFERLDRIQGAVASAKQDIQRLGALTVSGETRLLDMVKLTSGSLTKLLDAIETQRLAAKTAADTAKTAFDQTIATDRSDLDKALNTAAALVSRRLALHASPGASIESEIAAALSALEARVGTLEGRFAGFSTPDLDKALVALRDSQERTALGTALLQIEQRRAQVADFPTAAKEVATIGEYASELSSAIESLITEAK